MRSVEVVQQMIDWMEENMEELPTLQNGFERSRVFPLVLFLHVS